MLSHMCFLAGTEQDSQTGDVPEGKWRLSGIESIILTSMRAHDRRTPSLLIIFRFNLCKRFFDVRKAY